MKDMDIIIVKKNDPEDAYAGLRALWCDTFGDEPGFVDTFYDTFGENIKGYAAVDEEGRVCSSLTSFLCGTFEGKPAYISYAVCTAPDQRGRGLASQLIERAKEDALKDGGISVVSPAEPSLEAYYEERGYEPFFFAPRISLFTADDDDEYEDFSDYDIDIGDDEAFEAFAPGVSLKAADTDLYNRYREAFLANRPHIELSDDMLRMVGSDCEDDGGFFVINGGDAICVITTAKSGSMIMPEFILSPALEELSLEIDAEITVALARQAGAFEVTYSRPGSLGCQAMAAGITAGEEDYEEKGYEYSKAYFGFPIE